MVTVMLTFGVGCFVLFFTAIALFYCAIALEITRRAMEPVTKNLFLQYIMALAILSVISIVVYWIGSALTPTILSYL